MILYADTSVVVTALLLEPSTLEVRDWFAQAEEVASSVITYAEACAALGRRNHLLRSSPAELRERVAELDTQWHDFLVLPVEERAAGRAALAHNLRGMDAVQLSAAVSLRSLAREYAPESEVVVASFDRRLLEAAEREGFATLGAPLE